MSRYTVMHRMAQEIAELKEGLAKERDLAEAAIALIPRICSNCKVSPFGNGPRILSDGNMDDLCRTCLSNDRCNWEWRGPTKER